MSDNSNVNSVICEVKKNLTYEQELEMIIQQLTLELMDYSYHKEEPSNGVNWVNIGGLK